MDEFDFRHRVSDRVLNILGQIILCCGAILAL